MIKTLTTTILALWLGLASHTMAQEDTTKKINFSLETKISSTYMARGFKFSKGSVAQTTIALNKEYLTGVGFINYDFEQEKVTEMDVIVDYTKVWEETNALSLGYAYITFSNTELLDTQELYAIFSLDKPLNPKLTVVHDFGDGKGQYAELKTSLAINGVNFSAALGYNNHYYRNLSGLSQIDFGVSTKIQVFDNLSVTPSLNYTKALSNDFENQFYASASISMNF